MDTESENLTCPHCGSTAAHSIRYGHHATILDGEIYGGCTIWLGKSPKYGCPYCGHRWGVVEATK
jgi:DNA-directed RNA polymerase subunit RPC12/RpoP